jgi:hypothetical protein
MARRKRLAGLPRNRHWNEGWLTAWYGTDEDGEGPDVCYGSPCRPDGHLLHGMLSMKQRQADGTFGPSFLDELKARGYLIETLRFEIKRNRGPNEPDPRQGK